MHEVRRTIEFASGHTTNRLECLLRHNSLLCTQFDDRPVVYSCLVLAVLYSNFQHTVYSSAWPEHMIGIQP